MKTENEWRDSKLIPVLNKLPLCDYFIKEAHSVRGFADIIGCINGYYFALEAKKSAASMNHPRTKLQDYRLQKTRKNKGFGQFIYPENAVQVISSLLIHASIELTPSLKSLLYEYFPES